MYLNILKKDLKRKKTMNFILLTFIMLASMFISSSVNNLSATSSALDKYIVESDLPEFLIYLYDNEKNERDMNNFIAQSKHIDRYDVFEFPVFTSKNVELENSKAFNYVNSIGINTVKTSPVKVFSEDDQIITNVKPGEIYLTYQIMKDNKIKEGDTLKLFSGDHSITFTVKGSYKNIMFSATMIGMNVYLISDEDFEYIQNHFQFMQFLNYSIRTNQLENLLDEYNQSGINSIFSNDQSKIRMMYIMDIVIAGIILIVSICLILISIIILRFTIVFTLMEEFREIGVMKAIGIKTSNVRMLYCLKYFFMSVIGSFIGLLIGIPFGKLLMSKISNNIIFSSSGGFFINILCSLLVIILISLFTYFATGKIKKFSPIDAIRNGTKGERYKMKGILRLSKSPFRPTAFLALNDILSDFKKFFILILIFIMGILLITIPINTANTLKSDQMITSFSMAESDLFLTDSSIFEATFGDKKAIKEYHQDIKDTLFSRGIEADIFQEYLFKFSIYFEKKSTTSISFQGINVDPSKYSYLDGSAPKYPNEVGISHLISKQLDAGIGDYIEINTGEKKDKFLVTALYQTMNNLGEGVRFHPDYEIDYSLSFGSFAVQVKYKEEVNARIKEKNRMIIEELYPDLDICDGGEYVQKMTGVSIDEIVQLIVIIVLSINALVVTLMTKSFLTKEKGEIGMLKAIGFKNKSIIFWQIMRIGILLLAATLFGAILSQPLAQITSGQIFKMMGMKNMTFIIDYVDILVIYPLIIFAVTLTASYLSCLQIRKISASETNNIE